MYTKQVARCVAQGEMEDLLLAIMYVEKLVDFGGRLGKMLGWDATVTKALMTFERLKNAILVVGIL